MEKIVGGGANEAGKCGIGTSWSQACNITAGPVPSRLSPGATCLIGASSIQLTSELGNRAYLSHRVIFYCQ